MSSGFSCVPAVVELVLMACERKLAQVPDELVADDSDDDSARNKNLRNEDE